MGLSAREDHSTCSRAAVHTLTQLPPRKPFLPPQCCCLLGDFPGPPALSKPCLGSRHRGWSPSSPTSTSKQKQQAVPRGGRGEQSPLNPGRSAGLTPKEPMGETGQKHKQRL